MENVESCFARTERVGRPQTNLFWSIRSFLKERHIFLNNLSDLSYIRNLALNNILRRRLQFNEDLIDVYEKD